MSASPCRELIAGQKAMTLAEEIYRLTRAFPPEERYGLIGQVRRAPASIPANIADGQARGNPLIHTDELNRIRAGLLRALPVTARVPAS